MEELIQKIELDRKIKLERPLKISSNKVCVASDFHIPFQDLDLVENMIDTCRNEKIKTIIIPGDFLDCKNLSSFIDLQQVELTFEDELEEANEMLKLICQNFDDVYFTNSNHEARFAKKMEGNANIRDLYKMFSGNLRENIDYFVSIYDYCVLNGEWYVCHPNIFSVTPLSVARILSAKYHLNVATAHLHRLCLGKDISGKYWTLETGGLFDPQKLEYLQNTSKNPVQQSGYVIIEKNKMPILVPGKIQTIL
jgi:hypothetical protein